jgi:hypothetical protein
MSVCLSLLLLLNAPIICQSTTPPLTNNELQREISSILWKHTPLDSCDFCAALAKATAAGRIDVVHSITTAEYTTLSVNSVLCQGGTPLVIAAQHGQMAIVERLLLLGAKVNDWGILSRPEDERQDGYVVCSGKDHLLRDFVMALTKDESHAVNTVMNAAESKYIHSKSSPPEPSTDDIDRCYQVRTPLMAAAQGGHLDIIKMLVEKYDADTRAVALDGRTALRLARVNNHKEVSVYLQSRPSTQGTGRRIRCTLTSLVPRDCVNPPQINLRLHHGPLNIIH